MMKKVLWTLLIAAGVAFLAALAGGGWCYWRAACGGAFAVRKLSVMPEGRVPVGETATVRFAVLLPWGQELRSVTASGAPGAVVAGEPAVTEGPWERAGRIKLITATVKAVRAGSVEPGSLKLAVERPLFRNGAKMLEEEIKLPMLEAFVPELPDGAELPLAGEIAPPARPAPHRRLVLSAVVLAAIVLIAAALWFGLRRRRSEQAPEPWEIAAGALADLRSESRAGKRSAAWCVARLTDVVRDYLSARFQLPFSRQTTGEFLHSLNRPESPLTRRQGQDLGEFLAAADLVKFAGQTPERGYLDHAIDKAETLVAETRPQAPGAAPGPSGKED